MKKPPDFETVENLLKGQVRDPSPRFEEALRRIPETAADRKTNSLASAFSRIAAIAAVLIIATVLGLESLRQSPPETDALVSIQDLTGDPDLLALFSLSEDLELAASLLDEENQFALDYFSSAP
jgi:hypothetical protein